MMKGSWLYLAVFALAYLGLASLAYGMERHHKQLTRAHGSSVLAALKRVTPVAAWGWLIAALYLAISLEGAGPGSVLWLGNLTAAAMMLALLLTYAPGLARRLAMVSLPLIVLGMLVACWA
ncbi:DUF3325 domain-containing protein [Methylovorus sp. SPW-M1]